MPIGLTTYEQPRNEMVDVILKMIKGTIELETVTLPGTLIVRKSA
ncbi:DNA-binding LacI/PurR family transcriptional regulator [Agrobacterium tumefaciens]|uniref:DNA-binding LacI/PurR family transcriptional regulator n=1 Tax=Agrobacterium radiobacter TaxID=362 RepID=A0ABR6JBR0_AGRRD|nr:DNA-binding LacI/PurR family transcriptional regulator [Agrobacterium radiobacter]MBB4337377.1 DNA-binding LacI/PurR family transcriptional regulator [Agrobacterium radiobacter]MBB4492374.1 DNA-binding LacI/PurR family transcriptional regulator [Agrobacterium radiobacter]MBB4497273.1 DNA-binding LacI/PurR family transcriptional regulator [Agrobacterium radiobacter]MBB4502817.1 DNA-binding LacI/PurR family transcriptional regulator [Agrobacterium radiobacter]